MDLGEVVSTCDRRAGVRPDPVGMPDVACHAAAFEAHPPYRLFVANDCGVWMMEGDE